MSTFYRTLQAICFVLVCLLTLLFLLIDTVPNLLALAGFVESVSVRIPVQLTRSIEETVIGEDGTPHTVHRHVAEQAYREQRISATKKLPGEEWYKTIFLSVLLIVFTVYAAKTLFHWLVDGFRTGRESKRSQENEKKVIGLVKLSVAVMVGLLVGNNAATPEYREIVNDTPYWRNLSPKATAPEPTDSRAEFGKSLPMPAAPTPSESSSTIPLDIFESPPDDFRPSRTK